MKFLVIQTAGQEPPPSTSFGSSPVGAFQRKRLRGARPRTQFAALEGRTLYSADLGLAGAVLGQELSPTAMVAAKPSVESATLPAAYAQKLVDAQSPERAQTTIEGERIQPTDLLEFMRDSNVSPPKQALEVVLIDSRVPYLSDLRAELQEQVKQGRNLAILVVDAGSDGIQRASQMLEAAGVRVAALHIISHGQTGAFNLGATLVDSQAVEARSAELAQWSRYLSADADILIYGCDVAATAQAERFLSRLGEVTGADIAASRDLTGAKNLGGNWNLEYSAGKVSTTNIASNEMQAHWQGLLVSATSSEVTVNQNLPGDQSAGLVQAGRTIAVNTAGDIAVAWQDFNANSLMVRLFLSDGSPRTSELKVFDPIAEGYSDVDISLAAPSIAVREDGSFVLAWVERHISVADKVWAQRFTADGQKLGSRIDVDGAASHSYIRESEIGVDASGGFVVSYQVSANGSNYDVKASGFNTDGGTRFTDRQVGVATNNFEGQAALAVRPDGSFLVAWSGVDAFSGSREIYAQRLDASGNLQSYSASLRVNTNTVGTQSAPSIAVANDGSFVVGYTSEHFTAASVVDGSEVLIQRFNADGSKNGSELVLGSVADQAYNGASSVAVAAGGRIVVAWSAGALADFSAAQIATSGLGGLGYQSGTSALTVDALATHRSPSIATNGNLIVTDYSRLGLAAGSTYDVQMVTYIGDTSAYLATAPANEVPVAPVGMEDSALVLSLPLGNAIQISDSDAGNRNLSVSLAIPVGSGVLNISDASMVRPTAGGSNYLGAISGIRLNFKGNLADVNLALSQLVFVPGQDVNGTVALSVTSTELYGSAPLSDTDVVNLLIAPTNDAPTLMAPTSTLAGSQDTVLNLSGVNQVSVADVDAGSSTVTLSFNTLHGAVFVNPAGSASAASSSQMIGSDNVRSYILSGTVADINASLSSLSYQPDVGYSGGDILRLTLDDQGNTGSGGSKTASAQIGLSISPADAPPVFSLGSSPSASINEDTSVALANLFGSPNFSVSDPDAGSTRLRLELTLAAGQFSTTGAPTGLVYTNTNLAVTTAIQTSTISVEGDLVSLNSLIASLNYRANTNFNGADNFTIKLDDLQGKPQSVVSASRAILVVAVNDAPVVSLTASGSQVVEDTPIALGTIYTSMSVSDVDAGTGKLMYTLTATRGGLTLNTAGLGLFNVSTGAALTGTLTGASISFQADLTKGNAALPLVLFRPNVNANGIGFSVKLDVNDQGNTGNPLSALSGSASTSFSVSAVNDRAFPTISTTVTPVLEDTPTKLANIFANLSVADPDAGAAKLLVALSVDQGQLEFDTTGKSLFDSSTGALLSGVISGSTVQFKATVSATNAALPQFVFSPPLNANGTGFNLTLSVDDLGNTGASTGTGPNLVTRNFSVTPVNDFPFVQSALSLTSNAGVKEILSQGGLLTRDVESTAKDLIYTLQALPSQGELLLNNVALIVGGSFTQADIDAGALAYRSLASGVGADAIQLSVRDADNGAGPSISLKVDISANSSLAAPGSTTTSTAPSINLSSSSGSSASTVSTATAATAPASTTSSASLLSGASSTLAPSSGQISAVIVGSLAPSNSSAPLAALGPTGAAAVPVATQRNGPQGGSAILNPSAQAFAPALSAATSGSTSLEQVRLSAMPTAITSSVGLAPVSTPGLSPAASQANVSVSGEATTKPLEVEKTYFQPIGITLPLQAVNLDRLGKEVGFQKELAQVRDDVMQIAAVDRNVVASSIGVSASFTIGYILWLVRGGVLISSLLASLPAWRLVDPLPVLGTLGGKRKDEDDKSLEELVQGQADRQELQRQEANLQESRMQEPRRSGAASQFANKAELDEASFSMP